jgi:hypothetical protein
VRVVFPQFKGSFHRVEACFRTGSLLFSRSCSEAETFDLPSACSREYLVILLKSYR